MACNRCGNSCSCNGCLKLISSDCIISPNAYSCFGTGVNATVTDIFDAINAACSSNPPLTWESFDYACLPGAPYTTGEQFVEAISDFVCNLSNDVADNTADIADNTADITDLQTDVTALQTCCTDNTADIAALEALRWNYLYFADTSAYPIGTYNTPFVPVVVYSQNVLANTLAVGRKARIRIEGILKPSASPQINNLNILINGNTIASAGPLYVNWTGTDQFFVLEVELTPRTTAQVYSTYVIETGTNGAASFTTKREFLSIATNIIGAWTVGIALGGGVLVPGLILNSFSIEILQH